MKSVLKKIKYAIQHDILLAGTKSKQIIYSLILISTFACSNTHEKVAKSIKDNTPVESKVINSDKTKSLQIDFDNYSLIIHDYSVFNTVFSKDKDTLYLDEETGYSLDNKQLEIKPKNKADKFEVYLALENNLTVYLGEKQYQDLKDWKKTEVFQQLKEQTPFTYRRIHYQQQSKEKELEKDFSKIKSAVLKLRGEYITEKTQKVKSLKNLPIEFWISRVFIRIIRTSINGEKEEILLINNSSKGC